MFHQKLLLKNRIETNFSTAKGFTLIELLVVIIIVGISAAVGISNLIGSQRQARANEAVGKLRSALQSAQANANRMSTSCDVIIDSTTNTDFYLIRSNTDGCLQEVASVEKSIVNIDTVDETIVFNFNGSIDETATTITLPATFTIARQNGSTVDTSNANCLVVSSLLGLVRTGKIEGTNCINVENLKYDNEN